MASYIENIKQKMDWGNVFVRTGSFPLDRSSIFGSYSDAVKYAKGDGSDSRKLGKTSYIGQIITVYENGNVNVYKINGNRQLEEIGVNNGGNTDVTQSNVIVVANVSEINNNVIGQLFYCTESNNKGVYIINESKKVVKIISFDNDDETIIIDGGSF